MPNDVLDRFRTKYPQYANTDDVTLASGIVSKYPQYNDALKDVLPQPMASHEATSQVAPQRTLAQQLLGTITDPLNRFAKNAQYLKNAPDIGGKIGGAMGLLNAMKDITISGTGEPALETLIRKIPNNPTLNPTRITPSNILDAVNLPGTALDKLGRKATDLGLSALPDNLGTSPESAQKIKAELPEIGGTATQIGATLLGTKFAKDATNPQTQLAKSMEETRQVAPTGTGITNAKTAHNFEQTFQTASNDIGQAVRESGGINKLTPRLKQAEAIVGKAKDNIYSQMRQPIEALKDVKVDATPIAESVINDITPEMRKTDPALVDKITNYVTDKYVQEMSVPELFDHIQRMNAEIGKKKFYEKSGSQQAQIMGDPDLASTDIKATDAARELLFKTLEDNGVQGMPELRQRYGAVSKIGQLLEGNYERNRRLDERPNSLFSGGVYRSPISRGAQMAAASWILGHNPVLSGALDIGVMGSELIKNARNKPSPTIERAFNRLGKYAPQPDALKIVPKP